MLTARIVKSSGPAHSRRDETGSRQREGEPRAPGGETESRDRRFILDVDIQVSPGITILFGTSGSGKTTTLKSIAGIVRPDEGAIRVGEETLFDSSRNIDLPIRERRVGYVFQGLALFPHLSVRANVEFGMGQLTPRERRSRASGMMEALHIGHTADRRPRDISGGEAQRVALARALSCSPRVLLLDEPLSAVDEVTKIRILEDLKAINKELRLPVIYVTHSKEEAVTLGERVIVYEGGRVAASGEPLEVFGSPTTHSVARLTGVENIFDAVVVSKNAAGGTMSVELRAGGGACGLDVPLTADSPGEWIRLAVPAGDILLATLEPRSTSARNILRARITDIIDKSNRVLIKAESGVSWSVSVTRQSVNELGLVHGGEVWMAIKTHSCYRLDS
jgi:molybdate transport system ATP-binding protein